jgi:hypothetical protein
MFGTPSHAQGRSNFNGFELLTAGSVPECDRYRKGNINFGVHAEGKKSPSLFTERMQTFAYAMMCSLQAVGTDPQKTGSGDRVRDLDPGMCI